MCEIVEIVGGEDLQFAKRGDNFCTANCGKLQVGDKDLKIASLLMGKLAISRHIIYFAAPFATQLVTRSNSHLPNQISVHLRIHLGERTLTKRARSKDEVSQQADELKKSFAENDRIKMF